MRFSFSEDQQALKREARRFLEKQLGSVQLRTKIEATQTGALDEPLWRSVVELGWPSLVVPEAHGGAGLGFVELAAVLEETGRALLPAPLLSTALAALVIGRAGTAALKAAHLPALAEGRSIGTLAIAESSGRWEPEAIELIAEAQGEGPDAEVELRGEKHYVTDALAADLYVVAARRQDQGRRGPIELYLVPATAPGLTRRATPAIDLTRPLGALTFDGVRVPPGARLAGDGAVVLEQLLPRAQVALACEQVGAAERCLELSVEYAKTRTQFGRPIGSFQAIKHTLADMLTRIEAARSAAWAAAFSASIEPSEDPQLPELAIVARSYASEAFFRAAADTIQVHGGIGFTWEHDAHLFFRRAKSAALLFGDPAQLRERLARRIGL